MRISAIILIYINIYLYYETFLRVPNSLMTHDTHDTRDTFKDFLKKVTQKFVDRNGNVVPLPSQLRCNGDCGRRLSEGQASLPPHIPEQSSPTRSLSPCTAIVNRNKDPNCSQSNH